MYISIQSNNDTGQTHTHKLFTIPSTHPTQTHVHVNRTLKKARGRQRHHGAVPVTGQIYLQQT